MGLGQGKVVATLDVDRAGARVLSGSRDYGARIFDFNGMKADLRAFRKLLPNEGHPVHALSWSPSGARAALQRGLYTDSGVAGDLHIC